MSCDVCLYDANDSENEFFSQAVVKARKPHRCGECEIPVTVGTRYERSSGKSEGDFFTFASCLLCAEIRNVFHCGGSYYFGTLWDDMEMEAFPRLTTASECFLELSPEAKTYLMEKWRTWKGLTAPATGLERSGDER